MGLVDRLTDALASGDRCHGADGAEYQCSACGEVFDAAHGSCPRCGAADIQKRGSVEVASEDEEASATQR